ncbi:hypothetical protein BN946_scf185007.g60 [Trametes cinnabarina]|uniref:Uncharacterized protein n=1 Tax=Pycnoporus cinnabarinus TaxID=5643 RepID=A0A060SFL6_PYCCI|nr:hypothetical protein BN946_scf185007.g60 [Trametes cinnabarina]
MRQRALTAGPSEPPSDQYRLFTSSLCDLVTNGRDIVICFRLPEICRERAGQGEDIQGGRAWGAQSANTPVFGTSCQPTGSCPIHFQPQSLSTIDAEQRESQPVFCDIIPIGNSYTPTAKVDPSSIPLPPQSPPVSTVSFSSRSSASRSSASYGSQDSVNSRSTAPTLHSNVNGHGHERQGSRSSQARVSIDGLGIRSEPVTREPSSTSEAEYPYDYDSDPHHATGSEEDTERKRKAEAKSNRKIADLEITNRSLLAINSSLEATKHKQAREIRELRRKLRESRLILPPPAYRAVKSSLPQDDEESDEEEEDEEDDADIIEGKDDEPYRRVKVMVEDLIESCKRALESKPEDFVGSSRGVAKVLTEEEVRNWRGDDNDTETRSTVDPDDTSFAGLRPLTPSRVAVPSSDDDLDSEDEVEASLLEPDIEPLAPLPPITITSSASP